VGVLNLGLDGSQRLGDREEEALLSIAGALASLIVYRLTENEKQEVQKQLLRSQKVEAIGRLAGGLAHDLNNLLGAIQGFTEKSLMRVSDQQEQLRDALEHAHGAAVRASDLVGQLLVFGHKQPTTLAPMDVSASVAEVVSMIRPLIGEDIRVEADLAQDLPPVMADAGSIEQVLMNLSLNARDAMPQGGKLSVRTEEIVLDAKACQNIDGAFPDRFVRLTVTDTGVGIARENLDRIFDPFFSTKDMGSGTGLGLSVAHGIVKRLEGWINVESELGRGTTFRVYLLAFAGKPERKPRSDVPIELLRGSGERILLVEDEEFVREFAVTTLAEQGYEVVEAESAEQALELFRREEGKFELLFTDVVLPGRTGVQLAEELVSLKPDLAVLLTSAYIDEKAGWHIIRDKGFPFLKKPYRMALLLSTIRTVLAQVTRRDAPEPLRS
jgi:two-component system cell cycle sensor histidine kinase/response regulator CckA